MISSVIPRLNELWMKCSSNNISMFLHLPQREKDVVAKHAKEVQLYMQMNRHGLMLTRRLRIRVHTYHLQNTVVSRGQGSPDITRILDVSAVGSGYGVWFQLLDPDLGQR